MNANSKSHAKVAKDAKDKMDNQNYLGEVAQADLKPGKWYWWILPHPLPDEPHNHDKFCVVRCFEENEDGEKLVCVNLSESLEEDNRYYVGELGGKFYGPVEVPVEVHL